VFLKQFTTETVRLATNSVRFSVHVKLSQSLASYRRVRTRHHRDVVADFKDVIGLTIKVPQFVRRYSSSLILSRSNILCHCH